MLTTVSGFLLLAAFGFTLASAVSQKVPLWIAVFLLVLVGLLGFMPIK
jgi:hypothetical protein